MIKKEAAQKDTLLIPDVSRYERKAVVAATFKLLDEKNWLAHHIKKDGNLPVLVVTIPHYLDEKDMASAYISLDKVGRRIYIWSYGRNSNPEDNTSTMMAAISEEGHVIYPSGRMALTETRMTRICQRITDASETLEVAPVKELPIGAALDPIGRFLEYVTNPKHIWDPEKYLTVRNDNGMCGSVEVSLRYQYCMGSSYLTGTVGNLKLQIFYSQLQGFQITVGGHPRKPFPPHTKKGVIMDYIASFNPL